MKFRIITRNVSDKALQQTIINTFEYFATINKERAEAIEKKPTKLNLIELMQDLANYVEVGLKKKYSMNFNVLISEMANYALKYEKNCLLTLGYKDYSILVYKTPFICLPTKYKRPEDIISKEEHKILTNQYKEALLNKENYLMVNYAEKNNRKILKGLKQDNITDIIFNNISYCAEVYQEKDFLSMLGQSIQLELSSLETDYSWGVVIAKKHIYSDAFMATSNIFYHSKLLNNIGDLKLSEEKSKKLKAPKLKDAEILIYHKTAVFESVLKNIVTGKLHNVEIKHIFIFISVIIFFLLMSMCKSTVDYANTSYDDLSWFEGNVCKNKSTVLSTIGIMFIMIVLSGMIKKKIDKKQK